MSDQERHAQARRAQELHELVGQPATLSSPNGSVITGCVQSTGDGQVVLSLDHPSYDGEDLLDEIFELIEARMDLLSSNDPVRESMMRMLACLAPETAAAA